MAYPETGPVGVLSFILFRASLIEARFLRRLGFGLNILSVTMLCMLLVSILLERSSVIAYDVFICSAEGFCPIRKALSLITLFSLDKGPFSNLVDSNLCFVGD